MEAGIRQRSLAGRNFETQHLARKSSLAQRFPRRRPWRHSRRQWGGRGKAGSRFFWGGVHLPDHIFLVVILPVHFVGQPELSDPAHHWLMVNGHKKVSGAFCDVFYNQARPCDRHQSNPLKGPMTCFCGNRIETANVVIVAVLSLFKMCLFLERLEIVFVF